MVQIVRRRNYERVVRWCIRNLSENNISQSMEWCLGNAIIGDLSFGDAHRVFACTLSANRHAIQKTSTEIIILTNVRVKHVGRPTSVAGYCA